MVIYNITSVVKKAKKDGVKDWSDEDHIIRPIDQFINIFYAKYTHTRDDFAFWFEERKGAINPCGRSTLFLCCENVSGFRYCFPLTKP